MPIPARYKQNMEKGGISSDIQEKLNQAGVIVMGAGGLGSGVIMNLAALGVGHIKIVDDGVVQESDLNRQLIHKYNNIGRARVISAKDWIQDFNPDIKVEIEKTRLYELNYLNTIQGYDIIIDCFSSLESKYLLNDIALRHKKVLIFGGMQAFSGQVTTIFPPKTGCLACVMQKPRLFREEKIATISPVINVVSAVMAQEVLKIVGGIGEPLLNKILIFDALKSEFKVLNYQKNPNCEVCSEVYY